MSKELRHEFAYDKNGEVVTIESAVLKGVYYYYPDSKEVRLIFKPGRINQSHFSLDKRDNGNPLYGRATNETPLHRKAKYYIANKKEYEYDGYIFKAHSVKVEKATIEGTRFIPDVTFYDKEGKILCLIEVEVNHHCEEEKIEHLNKSNILTFEPTFKNDNYKQHTSIEVYGGEILKRLKNQRRRFVEIKKESEEGRENLLSVARSYREINTEEFRTKRKNKIEADSSSGEALAELERRHKNTAKKYTDHRERNDAINSSFQFNKSEYRNEINKLRAEHKRLKCEVDKLPKIKERTIAKRIADAKSECESLENTFNTIAERPEVKLENYMPNWIAKDIPKQMKVKTLKYWCF